MNKYLLSLLIATTSINLYSQNIYEGLVGYWPLNCNAVDSLGTNLDGTIIGSPSCTFGKLDEALIFSQGDYINLPQSRSLEMVSGNGFTWSLWFKLDSLPQSDENGLFQTFISFADDSQQSDIFLGLGSFTAPRDELAFIVDGDGGLGNSAQNNFADISWKPDENWEKDKWYHVAGLRDYDNNLVELYFDGIKRASATYLNPQDPFTENFPMQFARFFDGETASNNFTGGLDEIRIYDRVLTEAEVLILFSARPEQLSTDTTYINLGNIKCKSDSTLQISLKNEGPSEFILSDFDLKQGSAFSIKNPVSSEKLLAQEQYILGLTFEPPSEGIYYDTIFVNNPFGVQPMILYLEAEKEVQIDTPTSIDFGELVSCESNSFLVADLEINNINITSGLIFDTIELSSPTASASISSSTYTPLPEGNTAIYSLTFTPNSFGTFTNLAQIRFQNCDLSYPIEIKANYTFLEKDFSSSFNFGDREVGVNQTETQTIRNTGTTDIEILNIELLGNEGDFSFDSSTFSSVVIEPSSSFTFDIDYLPVGQNSSSTFLLTSSSKCGVEIDTIVFSGYGKYRATFNLKPIDINVKAGETRDLFVQLASPLDLDISEIDSISFDLSLNRTVAKISSNRQNLNSSTVSNFIGTYNYTIIPDLTNSDQEFKIDEIKFALGNESAPLLELSNLIVYNGIATINIEPGAIILDDLCEKGDLTRLILADGWLELGNVSPNPASSEINFKFSLIEPGNTSIKVYDSNGLEVENLVSNYFDPGTYRITFPTINLQSGAYFYVLETPTQTISKRFQIAK